MRQIRRTEHELILQFSDREGRLVRFFLRQLGKWLGIGCLFGGLWLGFRDAPILVASLVVFGSLCLLINGFIPRLTPEIATCIFNRSRNKLTVIHELAEELRDSAALSGRNVAYYRLTDIVRFDVYRMRTGLFSNTYSLLIELAAPSPKGQQPTLIRIDGLHDRILIQRGRVPVQLLSKEISYHLGRPIQLSWSYIDVPQEMGWSKLGRRIIPRSSVRRLSQVDIRRMAREIEQFIKTP
ncbi:MAG: hypothetical protein AAF152_19555 [Cyanobacteria bacterium P01_A01_bin.114]